MDSLAALSAMRLLSVRLFFLGHTFRKRFMHRILLLRLNDWRGSALNTSADAQFIPLNVAGRDITVSDLASIIGVELNCKVTGAPLPKQIAEMEIGEAEFDGSGL
ncbi:MAG: hypothetical protein R3C16_10945 [Hyphomonadaceae bacterium]